MKKYGVKGQLSDTPQLGESVVVLAWEAEAAISAADAAGYGRAVTEFLEKGYVYKSEHEQALTEAEQRGIEQGQKFERHALLSEDGWMSIRQVRLAVEEAEQDMLAKCIETVEGALISTEDMNSSWNQPIHVALEYLDYLKRGSND